MRLRVLTVVAVVAALGCGGGRPDAGSNEAAPPSGAIVHVGELMPADGDARGWRRSGEAETYGESALWEYIDGAAESYLEYGFQEVVTGEFSGGEPGESVVVDVFHMADPLHAFGIYRHELPADPVVVPEGAEGHATGSGVRFWAGPYYVKVTGSASSAGVEHAIQELAGAVARRIGDPGGLPPELELFPGEGLRAASIRFVPADVLGLSWLRRGFEATYSRDGDEGRLVLVEQPDASAAAAAVAELERFVATSGKPVAAIDHLGDGGFSGGSAFYGGIAVVSAGERLVAAVGFSSPEVALQLLEQCVEQLSVVGGGAPGKGE